MAKRPQKLIPYALILLQSLLYGFGDPISKAAYERIPVCSLLAVRYLIAFAFLMLLAGKTVVRELRSMRSFAWIAPSVCIAVSYVLSNLALKLTAATSVAFLRSLATVMTPLLALIFFRKRYGLAHAAVGLASVLGLYLLCSFGGLSGFGMGEILSLLGALTMAGALLFGEKALSQMRPLTLTTVQAAASTTVAFLAALLFEGGVRVSQASCDIWAIIVYLAIGCTAAGYLLQNHALRSISARTVALLQCACPVFTAAFSYLILRERLSAAGMLGALIILLCVAAEIRIDRNREETA
ncbi:MAG: DMT family transporter [Oscillospiraceae bacterium]|nr:DMT family transporter [Oscillospiraceae bacterium]